MKRFYELTKEQQDQAVEVARSEIKELISIGLISSDQPLTKEHLDEFAVCAAEDALYSEKTDKVIEGIVE